MHKPPNTYQEEIARVEDEILRDNLEGCDGYFFVCGITWPGQAFNPGKAFRVVDQLDEAKRYVRDLVEAGQDVYFTPGLFSRPERKAEYLKPGPLIWSDVDDGHTEGTNPIAVWTSSPGTHRLSGV